MCLPSADLHANRTAKPLETSRPAPSFQVAQDLAGPGIAALAALLEELAAALWVDAAVVEQVPLPRAPMRHASHAGAREVHGGSHRVLRGGVQIAQVGAAERVTRVATLLGQLLGALAGAVLQDHRREVGARARSSLLAGVGEEVLGAH